MNNGLSERAVLISLVISRWRGKGRSKEVDARVTEHLQTKRKAGTTQIDLLDPKEIRSTQNAAYRVWKWFKSHTLPWDEKFYIMPAALHDTWKEGHESKCEEFYRSADDFTVAFPSLRRQARQDLGDELFELLEFPPISGIRSKFAVNLSYHPVPAAGDFRIKLSNEEMTKIQEELAERNKAMLARSMHDAWKRLHDVVSEMTERIYKPKFRDSMINNIKSLTDLLPDLNLAEDPELEQMRTEVVEKLCRYTPEQLRHDDTKREELANAATHIVGSMRRLRTDLNEQ